jgi:hypothetical protein
VILSLGAKKYDWMSGLADLSVEEAIYIGDYNLTINGATYTSQNGRVTLPGITEGDLSYTVSNHNSLGYPDVITYKGNITVEPASLTLQVPGGAVPGGTIEISDKLNNSAVAGVSVGVTIKDPTGSLVYVDETRTGDDASFEFSFTLPDNASCGEWQVQVAGGGATASKTFSVGGVAGVVNASPSSVKPGGAVTISGKVAQGGVPVGITVKNPSGGVAIADQTTAGADGGYSFQFNLPADAPTGTWTADVAGGGSAGRATFELISPPQPGIELDAPSSAVLGETLEIKGQYTGEEVSGVPMAITVKDSNGAVFYVDETSTGTDGSFNFSLTISSDAPTGVWTVDVAGGGANAYQSFSVGEPADNKVSVNVSPSSVKPGGAVTISGKVPQDNVPVGITVKDPNGGVAFVEQTTAGADGSYTFQFNVPNNALAGTWTADVAGGGSSGSATFTVKSSSGGGGGGGGGGSSHPVISTTGSATVAPADGGTISLGSDASVVIPAHALKGTTGADVSIQKLDNPPVVTAGFRLLGSVFEFTVDGNTSYEFSKPVTLTFSFDPTALKPGETLAVYYFDATSSQWVKLGGNISGSTINVTVDHFTKYCMLASREEKMQPVAAFKDITGHWAEKDIEKLAAMRAVAGYPDGTFKPDNNITRAEFAVLLAKALGWPAKPGGLGFADAAEIPDWARGYISAAMDKGVISGFEDNTFKPNRPITRSEITVIVVRALGLAPEAGALNFSDASEIPDWAEGYIAAAVNQGIIVGKPGNIFAPDDNATRAEAASLVLRLMNSLGI